MIAAALKKRRRRPMLLLDLAIPGDIDPAIDAIDDAFRYGFDDLERLAMSGRKERAQAMQAAYAIVDADLAQFLRCAGRTRCCRHGRRSAVRISRPNAWRSWRENPQMDAAEVTRRLVNRLLHRPITALEAGPTGKIARRGGAPPVRA